MENIDNFKKELKSLLIKYDVYLGVDIEGDTHGTSSNFIVAKNNSEKYHILSHYQDFIYSSDL